ncbi:hypothetical protein JOB18_045822 [Solea senegalensis]|uniref:Uncharacterized protein n=1 Tax=Solea senegalensis TaxID=28829 RepID=A0AAV6QBS2_SOLSE|nr:hypothetical protein JOB18_045822 [Solea senegalensis]
MDPAVGGRMEAVIQQQEERIAQYTGHLENMCQSLEQLSAISTQLVPTPGVGIDKPTLIDAFLHALNPRPRDRLIPLDIPDDLNPLSPWSADKKIVFRNKTPTTVQAPSLLVLVSTQNSAAVPRLLKLHTVHALHQRPPPSQKNPCRDFHIHLLIFGCGQRVVFGGGGTLGVNVVSIGWAEQRSPWFGGLIQVALMELSDEGVVQHMSRRDPGPLLRAIAFPVHQVLEPSTTLLGLQEMTNGVSGTPINEARRWSNGDQITLLHWFNPRDMF